MPSPAAIYYTTVQQAFNAYYGRPGDAAGVRFWAEYLLANGGDVEDMITDFANSAESLALYGPINATTIGSAIDKMYLQMFGRLPDAAGKAFYIAEFTSGNLSAGQVAWAIYQGAQNSDAVMLQNKLTASNTFTQIQDGRTYAADDFGTGTVFNATYAGDADANTARTWLTAVTANPTTIPSTAQTVTFIKGSIANAGDPILQPEFTFVANVASIIEGGTVVFTLSTKNPLLQAGQTYTYQLSGTGLTASEVVGGLTGTVTLDSNGKATVTVVTINDYQLDGPESLTITLVGVAAGDQTAPTVTINENTSGKVFNLTPAIDTPPAFMGTPFDDEFNGNGGTLNPGDNIQGAGGYDVFKYASGDPGGPVMQSGFTAGDIEHFHLTADADTTFDMSGVTGLLKVTDTNSRADLTLTNGAAIHDLEMVNTTVAHDLTVAYQASTVSGGSNAQNLLVSGVLAGSNVTVNGIETFNVTTTGVSSSLNTIASNTMRTFNLDGPASLTLNSLTIPYGGTGNVNTSNGGSFTVGNLMFSGPGNVNADNGGSLTLNSVSFGAGNSTIDASGIGGSMYVYLANAAAASRNVAVTGSNSGDWLDVSAGFNNGDTFNGLGGDDAIQINADNFGPGANAITNTEDAYIWSGTLGTFDLGAFDGNLEDVWVDTGTAGVITFQNYSNSGSDFIHIWDPSAALNGKTIRFDPAVSGFGGTTVNLEVNGISGINSVTLQDFDTNGAASQDPVGTLNLFLNTWGGVGTGEMQIILDPWAALTTLGLAGDADIIIDAIPPSPTVTLVNGSTTTGDVTINAGVLSNSGATVFLGSGLDTVYAGSGDDYIDIGTGGGYVEAGDGDDTVIGTGAGAVTFYGEDGNDELSGGDGDDTLSGGNGADTLLGNGGEDTLSGDGGSDTIDGGLGDDQIQGGLGADILTGGGGDDTFSYENTLESHGAFTDIITDFVSGSGDLIDVLVAVSAVNPSVTSYDDMVFVGNAAGVAAAQSALSGTGGVEIVYDTINEQVYIDVDGDGTWTGLDDMVIRFNSPATMQASDFGITQGNTFTAAFAGFDTQNPATSLENTTTSNANDIVNTTAAQLPGSIARGLGGTNVFNVRTTITAPIDLATVMILGDFDRLNLPGGSTAMVIGPDQTRDLDIYIGNGGSFFETGTNMVGGIEQNVNSGDGDDFIVLTNTNDDASTRGGKDQVFVGSGFFGYVNLGDGADTLDVAAGASTFGATFIGGGDANDVIFAHNAADISGADISGFDRVKLDGGASSVTMDLDDYNGLAGSGPFGKIEAAGFNDTVNLIGGGTADLDENTKTWTGDADDQTFILATQSPNPGPVGNAQIVSTDGGVDEIVSNSSQLHGKYDGGGNAGDKFTQNGDSNWTIGTAATFSGYASGTLTLNNTDPFGVQDVVMSNAQHNSFGNIVGNDGFLGSNRITLTDTFTGTTQNTIEVYDLFNPASAAQWYEVGGSNQTVNDPNSGNSHIDVLAVSNTVINQTGGGNDLVHAYGSTTNLTLNTGAGNDTIDMTFFTTSHDGIVINSGAGDDVITLANTAGATISTGDGLDTVVLTNVTGLSLVFDLAGTPDKVTLNGTVSGAITEATAGPLNYTVNSGADLSGLSTNYASGFGDNVTFQTNGSFILNDGLYDQFAAAPVLVTAAGGGEKITISNTASIVALSANNAPGNSIENYVFASAGNDTFAITIDTTETSNYTLNIAAGGADKITIDAESPGVINLTSRLIVTGFNVADDQIRMQFGGTASGTFQEITVGGTALTVAINGTIELNTAVGALINPLNTGVDVLNLIAASLGDSNGVGVYNVAAYAADGNAYLYWFGTSAAAGVDITAANITGVQLVGQLNSVAANSLTLGNFFAP